MLELSLREARRLMIGAQLLAGPPPKRPTKARMLEVIRHLGAVQIDSISVVQRSHHIVLWNRLGNHPAEWLNELHGKDRAIFEYWVHAAAYAPIEYFPYFRRDMLGFMENGWSRLGDWLEEHPDILDRVTNRVRENGPVTTKSFDPPEGAERAAAWAWYGNKPTNLAVDILWRAGVLMIDRRDKFQRVYELTERILPEWDDAALPTLEEERMALSKAALQATGIMTDRWLPDYFRTKWGKRSAVVEVLENMVECGHAVRAAVKGIEEPVYVSTTALEKNFRPSRTALLTPFDSLIWDRRRTRQMFDFEVTLEIYVPKEERQFGYYCLPILYRDRLVGRLDPKVHRATGELTINALHLEPWFVGKDNDRFYASLAGTINSFRDFNGANHVTVTFCNPPESKTRLEAALASA